MTDTENKIKEQTTRKRPNPWTLRVVVILFIWVLIYFFFAGPGRLLFPSLLISYTSVSDNKNTVYFYGDRIEKALDVLWLASVTQDSIEHFWGEKSGDGFKKGVTIFLCDSPRQYVHLTWNKEMGSAVMGRMVLNESRIEEGMTSYSVMIHEMYQLYITRKFGYLPSVFFYPKWFEEGCATMLQEYSVAADKLGENLRSWPAMVSVTSLNRPWSWQTMADMEDGKMASKGYGQVCLFTRYLESRFGKEKLQEYEAMMHWTSSPKKNFKRVFQLPLATVESEWLQSMKETQEAPEEASFIPLPFDCLIFLRWLFLGIILLFPIFLIVRWVKLIFSRRK
ncbi:MAG: hypothetical protein IH596_11000 [Bacteroidales bacterium]|nr:hypothetical protein [Bacteroidales bacterium]